MKKSSQVTLTIVATLGLAGCTRRDPCAAATFNDEACRQAVDHGGYYWGGSWYPMHYGYPYPYYYDNYRRYASSGGSVTTYPTGAYSRSASGVERGGFGSTARGGSGE